MVRRGRAYRIETVLNKIDARGLALSELERSATDHSTRISELEANVGSLTTRVAYLDNRCEDLEGPDPGSAGPLREATTRTNLKGIDSLLTRCIAQLDHLSGYNLDLS